MSQNESSSTTEGAQTAESHRLETHINARMEAGFQDLANQLNLPSVEAGASERRRSLRFSAFLTAGVGLAFSVLFLVSVYLLSLLPPPSATNEDLLEFYGSSARRAAIVAGIYVMPFAGIAFLWFIVALRMWVSASTRRISELSANLHLVSGILFIAMFFVSAAATASTAATVEFVTTAVNPETARLLPEFGSVVMIVFGVRMAAIFVFSTSNIGREGKVLPRWFVFLGYGVGIFLLLSASLNPLLVLVFPAWMIVLCVILLLRARKIPKDAVLPGRGGKIQVSAPAPPS